MYDAHVRARGIGASDIASILGISPFADRGPWSVALRKRFPNLEEEKPQTDMQAIGQAVEKALVSLVPGATHNAEPQWLDERFYATPDGLTADSVVEAKCVGRFMSHHWDGGVPDYVRAQVQWQMLCCKRNRAIVVAFLRGEVSRYEVERDDNFLHLAVQAAHRFLADYENDCVHLACDASEACRKYLKLTAPAPLPADARAPIGTLEQRIAYYKYESANDKYKACGAERDFAVAELLKLVPLGQRVELPEGVLSSTKNGFKLKVSK